MKKKILILANHSITVYNFKKELIQELIGRGCEVYVTLPFDNKIKMIEDIGCKCIDVPVDRRGLNPIKDMKLLLRYLKIIHKIKPDKVLTYTIKPNLYGGLASRLLNREYCAHVTGLGSVFQTESSLKKIIKVIYKIALKGCTVTYFENTHNREVFLKEKIIDDSRSIVLSGSGVNLEEYEFMPLEDNEEVRFLYMGRMMREKGVNELLDVAVRIKKAYSNVEFDFVGFYEENFKEIVEDLVEKKVINYYGFQEDVKPFVKRATCVVLPSYHEGMSNTLLESAAMGRPIITTNIPGCKETITETSGMLVEVQDRESLYKAVEKFILSTIQEKQQMSREARKHIEYQFDRALVVEETIKWVL